MGLIAPFQNASTVWLKNLDIPYGNPCDDHASTSGNSMPTLCPLFAKTSRYKSEWKGDICLVLYMITTSVSFIYNPETINWVFSRKNTIALSRISVSRIY